MRKTLIILLSAITLLLCAGCTQEPTEFMDMSPVDKPAPLPLVPRENPATTPAAKPEKPLMRFVLAGDSRGLYHDELGHYEGNLGGVNTEVVDRMLRSIEERYPGGDGPLFMMTLGDYMMGSEDASLAREQMEIWIEAVTKHHPLAFYYPCYGNHEALTKEGGIALFSELFDDFQADEFFREDVYGRSVYYFQKANCNFFVLNSNSPNQPHRISDAVIDWVEQTSNNGARFNLIFVHEPAFPSGNHVGRSLDVDEAQRDMFWAAIEKLPGVIVFNAHEHQYARRRVNSGFNGAFVNEVYQITTAGMGAPFHSKYTDSRGMVVPPILTYHYLVADIYVQEIEFSAYTLDGMLLDRFWLSAGQKVA